MGSKAVIRKTVVRRPSKRPPSIEPASIGPASSQRFSTQPFSIQPGHDDHAGSIVRWFLKRSNLSVQTALVTRCFVLVYQAFSGHRIKNRYCRRVGFRRGTLITGVDRCNYTFNMSSHHRAHTCVAGTSCFRLTSTFFCLGGVRQVSLLENSEIEKLQIQPNSIVRAQSLVNQRNAPALHNRAYFLSPASAAAWYPGMTAAGIRC